MAITQPKTQPKKNPDKFIAGAPDAAPAKGVIRGKRQIITTGFSPEAIDRMNRAAARHGISRAAWLNMIVNKALDDNQ